MLINMDLIIQELIARKYIDPAKAKEVAAIINGDIQSYEYKLKKRIEEALANEVRSYNLKGTVAIEDINNLYEIVITKFKESAPLTREDLRHQAKQYYGNRFKQYKFPLTTKDYYIASYFK